MTSPLPFHLEGFVHRIGMVLVFLLELGAAVLDPRGRAQVEAAAWQAGLLGDHCEGAAVVLRDTAPGLLHVEPDAFQLTPQGHGGAFQVRVAGVLAHVGHRERHGDEAAQAHDGLCRLDARRHEGRRLEKAQARLDQERMGGLGELFEPVHAHGGGGVPGRVDGVHHDERLLGMTGGAAPGGVDACARPEVLGLYECLQEPAMVDREDFAQVTGDPSQGGLRAVDADAAQPGLHQPDLPRQIRILLRPFLDPQVVERGAVHAALDLVAVLHFIGRDDVCLVSFEGADHVGVLRVALRRFTQDLPPGGQAFFFELLPGHAGVEEQEDVQVHLIGQPGVLGGAPHQDRFERECPLDASLAGHFPGLLDESRGGTFQTGFGFWAGHHPFFGFTQDTHERLMIQGERGPLRQRGGRA